MKIFLLSFFFLLCSKTYSQINLVPNFSFEQYDTCPNSYNQMQNATGWSKYSISSSTPDYYNACASYSSGISVPKGGFCNQVPHRGCSAYTGLITWGASGNDREYAGIQLSSSLIVGQKYFLSFYTVMTESYAGGSYFGMPSNNIGMRLSTIPYDENNPTPINNFAHLNSSVVISDSVNWIHISGSIIADSAYQYVMLGNFFDDSNTVIIPYSCGSCLNVQSYYLYDDICVSTDSLLCNGGIDAISCTVSIPELIYNNDVTLFPNPAADMVTITLPNNKSDEIILVNMFGDIYYTEKVNAKNSVTLNLMPYPSGIYFLKIINKKGEQTISRKVVKL